MSQYELNFQDYWRIIKKRRWVIFLAAAVVTATALAFTSLQTPIYQASATVKVEPTMVIPGVSMDQSGWDMYTALNTEVKIIRSTLVAEMTAKKLGLITETAGEAEKAGIIAGIQGKVSADRIGDANLITISATSSDPREVARLANATAEVYIEKGIDDRNRQAHNQRSFIEIQMTDAESKLKKSEDELRLYLQENSKKGIGGYLATRLSELQTRRSEMLKKYTEQHPEVQRLKQQIIAIEAQMKELPIEEMEYSRLSREVKINEELYTLLAKRYKEAQIAEADRVQSAFIVTPAVEPGAPVKPNRRMNALLGVVLGIISGLIFAIFIENLDTSIGTIEGVEKYLNVPVLGIIPHVESDPKHKLPHATGKEQRAQMIRSKLIVYQSSKSPFVESYHTLRTNLKYAGVQGGGSKGKIIAFTSAGIGEGKTITASNFALAAAESGVKTILIETDLRRPNIHRIFGLNRDPGLSDCLIGARAWTDVMRGTADFLMSELTMENILKAPGIENLKLISSGPIPPNPVDLFNSPALGKILGEITQHFELVVLDCPPVLLFADTLIVGTHSSATIIVYQAGKMARGALKRAKDQLANVKVPVAGVVLNDLKASDMEPGYGYYYGYKYYSSPENQS